MTPLRSLLRWVLQADRPVPQRTEAELRAEVARNYQWNFVVSVLDFALFWFGASFASSATILPLFVSKLTTSTLPLGLVAVIAQGGWYLPQLFTANLVERLPRKKPVVVTIGFFVERVPIWLLVVAAAVAGDAPTLALALLLLGWAGHNLGAGLVATSWQDLVARCFPVDRRGRFFGIASFLGAGTGALGAALSTWLLQTYHFPVNFVYVFIIAVTAITGSWVFLALIREPVQPVTAPRQSNRQFFAGLPDLLRADVNFRRFLVARLVLAAGNMGLGFVTVAAVYRWRVADSIVGVYTAAMLVGQTMGNLAFGLLSDRFGHKLSLELGILASCLAFALAWLSPWAELYLVVFVLLGIGAGAVLVSGVLVVMEFSEPQRRPTYIGIANTGLGLVASLAPLVGASLAGVSYGWLFALCAMLNLLALALMRWWVRDPRETRRG